MFSLVLMVAMSQGTAAPAWETAHAGPVNTNFIHAEAHQHYRGRGGCGGCYGGCYGGYGCYGGGYGCRGGGYGCYGGGYGCRGGCYGGCGGGYGGCYGGYGCCGGGYGGYYGSSAPMGYVSSGYYGSVPVSSPGYYGTTLPQGTPGGEVRDDTLATLEVSLPEGTTLKIDDFVSQSTDTTRRFVSPPLEAGKEYHYDITAEVMRDGKPVTVRKRVAVRAGETTRLIIDASGVTVAQR
jgi:uncharacterized protein (TIGR03000 family)